MQSADPRRTQPSDQLLPETRWGTILAAKEADSDESLAALGRLCERYRAAIIAYTLAWSRRWIPPASSAEVDDLVQVFLISLGRRVRHVTPDRGRFRAFLLTCLKNYLRDCMDARVPPPPQPPPREEGQDPPEIATPMPAPEKTLDREVALECHRAALAVVRARWAKSGFTKRFEALREFLFASDRHSPYADVAKELDMNVNSVSKAVFDMREQYSDAFRKEVAEIATREDLADEMRYLLALLADEEMAQ